MYILLALGLLLSRTIASVVLPVYDDAFITFRYARNLAIGNGFVYNPGEWVLGTTSPLFGLVCSLFYRVDLPMPGTVVGLNVVLDVLVLALTLLAVPGDARRRFAWLFAFLFALSPSLSRVCVGGMEMNLFLAGSLVAVHVYNSGRIKSALVLATIVYFIRPEALILVLLMGVLHLGGDRKRRAFQAVALAGTILVVPLSILHHTYGHFLPQSVLAKSEDSASFSSVVKHLLAPEPLAVLLLLPALAGLWIAFRRTGVVRILSIWVILYTVAYCVARPTMWSWYGEPVYYGVLVLATLALIQWFGGIAGRLEKSSAALLVSACIMPVAVWALLLVELGPSPATRNVYRPLERWCRLHVTSEHAIVASDIGAVGYYSNARIYDLAGLVTREGYHTSLAELIADRHPEFLFLNATKSNVELMSSGSFSTMYEPVARFSKSGEGSLQLDPADLPDFWVQDYVVFRRVAPGS